jgi:hypothetical protein
MTMPAGTYWVGDLCYVLSDEDWDEVCELTIHGNTCLSGEFSFKDGRKFAMYSTEWGDGEYHDQAGFSYSVDSGSIGCILLKDISLSVCEEGSIVNFQQEFETKYLSGTICFGSRVMIDTNVDSEQLDDGEEYVC